MNQRRLHYFILVLILLAGFVLRFWDFWHIPFTFDELSAMGRTTYDNFSDLIQFGVIERDSHPAGIQVFLYYLTKVFGEAEVIVKLPFLIAGLLSVLLSYKIGLLWFGKTNGILTAAFASSLQLFVMYSQIARPYSSGLFFALAMVWCWSKYFFVANHVRYLAGFVLFAALSAYNHYFSLLFAATVGVSGLLFVTRKTVVFYLLSGVAVLILYLPHLQIFMAQAEKGSIGGWLGMPGPWFPVQFLHWLFHYSFWSYGVFILVLVFGIMAGRKTGATKKLKKRSVLFFWLLPAPIFGYVYSVKVEPILQYSLLIFSAPFIFIFLFSFAGKIDVKKLAWIVPVILVVNILTLTNVRKHYQIFYKQPFEQVVKEAIRLDETSPGQVSIINDYTPYYTEYYFRKYNQSLPYYSVRNQGWDYYQFDSVVSQIKENWVITSGLKPDYFQIVKKHFPYWIGYDYGFTFQQYTFSETPPESQAALEPTNILFTDFRTSKGNWRINSEFLYADSLNGNVFYRMPPEHEWGPQLKFRLDSLSANQYFFVDISVELKPFDSICGGVVVAEILTGNERIAWFGMDIDKFRLSKGKWGKAFMTISVQDALGQHTLENCVFKTFLWNPNKNDFLIKNYQVNLRPGNPYRYALFHDFTD